MGFHPKPRQGTSPLHPAIGASPQREQKFGGGILLWIPQPQSSRRALPCPPLVSVDSYGSLCASRKCPQGTREPPSPIWGYAPKPRARGLAMHRKRMCSKGRGRGVCAAALQLIEKIVSRRMLPLFQRFISSKKRLRAKRLARGLGRSPKWARKAKAEWHQQTLYPLGAKPQ